MDNFEQESIQGIEQVEGPAEPKIELVLPKKKNDMTDLFEIPKAADNDMDTSDLFTAPHEEDDDIYTDDLVDLDVDRDVIGGDMNGMMTVSKDDIIGRPPGRARTKEQIRYKRTSRKPMPQSGVMNIRPVSYTHLTLPTTPYV